MPNIIFAKIIYFISVKRYIFLLAKIAILLLLGYILYRQVFENRDLAFVDFVAQWRLQWATVQPLYLLAAIFLMPINWAFEVAKWLPSMQKVEPIGWLRATAAVLAGAAVSMFTPNRIGEYGGRILLVSTQNRPYAIITTLLGSWAQWLVLLSGGLLAFLTWAYLEPSRFSLWQWLTIAATATFFLSALLIMYRNVQRAVAWLSRWAWLRKYLQPLAVQLADYQPNSQWLWRILLMAAARYVVYFSQYLLMLSFWGLPLSALQMSVAVGLIYFIQTGVPLPPSTGLLARGNIALFVFALLLPPDYIGTTQILSATFSLWLLNVFLPAVFGGGVLIYCLFWQKEQLQAVENRKT